MICVDCLNENPPEDSLRNLCINYFSNLYDTWQLAELPVPEEIRMDILHIKDKMELKDLLDNFLELEYTSDSESDSEDEPDPPEANDY